MAFFIYKFRFQFNCMVDNMNYLKIFMLIAYYTLNMLGLTLFNELKRETFINLCDKYRNISNQYKSLWLTFLSNLLHAKCLYLI